MTNKKTIKRTTKKSTSSHALKLASKSKGKKAIKKIPQELQEAIYNKETLKNVYAIGSKFLKASVKTARAQEQLHLKFEKSTVAQTYELISLSASMLNEAKKNHVSLNITKLRRALFKFVQYDVATEVKQFEMAISRIADKAIQIFENPKFSISEKTAQLLDEKGNVISVAEIQKRKKASGKVVSRPNAKGKNQTQSLSEIQNAIAIIKGASAEMLKNVDLTALIEKLQKIDEVKRKEIKEKGNDHMKNVGVANLPKNAFANKSATV